MGPGADRALAGTSAALLCVPFGEMDHGVGSRTESGRSRPQAPASRARQKQSVVEGMRRAGGFRVGVEGLTRGSHEGGVGGARASMS